MKNLTGGSWILFAIDPLLLSVPTCISLGNLDRVEGLGTLLRQLGLVLTAGCAAVFAFTSPGRLQDRSLWLLHSICCCGWRSEFGAEAARGSERHCGPSGRPKRRTVRSTAPVSMPKMPNVPC